MTTTTARKHIGSRDDGFTLVEVMVATLILGVALAVGATAFARRSKSSPPVAIAMQMRVSLLEARRDAILGGTGTAFTVNIEKRTYTYPPGSTPHELPAGMALRMKTSREFQTGHGQYLFRFNPDGSTSGGEIVLSDKRRADARIELHWLTGIPRVATEPGK